MFATARGSSTLLSKAVANSSGGVVSTLNCSSRAFTAATATAKVAQRLASNGVAFWRLTAVTGGGLVLVGGGTAYASSSGGTANISSFGGFSWPGSHFLVKTQLEEKVVEEENPPHNDNNGNDAEKEEEETTTEDKVVMATSTSDATAEDDSLWTRLFGGGGGNGGSNSGDETKEEPTTSPENNKQQQKKKDQDEDSCYSGPGKRVSVQLEEEVLESLPIMTLKEVQKCTTTDHLLVTYEGIVYDVTQFVKDHPGGAELLLTAAGLDLDHFFGNYTVHGRSDKAAQWLAPLAVGKLSPEEAVEARETTTAEVHVERRQQILTQKRRKMIFVASTLPVWITLRFVIGWIGYFVPPLGRFLAWTLPVTVPGLTKGSEQLDGSSTNAEDEPYKVAIIGGGIAGCGAAWALSRSGFDVTLYEAREQISGNARTFKWDFSPFRGKGETVESCVSVTAWPEYLYKNYTCLLKELGVETVHQPLSWFLKSRVPGYEGILWEADPKSHEGSLRKVFAKDFERYRKAVELSRHITNFFTLKWTPWRLNDPRSMYDMHTGLGLLNPLTMVPLYSLYRMYGGSDAWWDIVFTPVYTASFLVDDLRPLPGVFGRMIEDQIPLNPNPTNSWQGSSSRSSNDCNVTTCVTWKDAGKGIRKVFDLLVKDVTLKENTRIRQVEVLPNGKKRVYDEFDNYMDCDRVIFACPSNAVGNIFKEHTKIPFANTIMSTLIYADDLHPTTGHMHGVMHSDATVFPEEYREDCLKRASNYVEVTKLKDGSINIENQYNFGVQTPGPGVYDLPLDQKPVMLISHALSEGKSIDPSLVRGTGNHARAHPLYSGWNVASQLSLRLIQGRDGIYYCSNWTTPGNCHDMSLLSGLICAHAIGAKYPFEDNKWARQDFHGARDLMGI